MADDVSGATEEQTHLVHDAVVKVASALIAALVVDGEGRITPLGSAATVAAVMFDVASRLCAEAGLDREQVTALVTGHLDRIFVAKVVADAAESAGARVEAN